MCETVGIFFLLLFILTFQIFLNVFISWPKPCLPSFVHFDHMLPQNVRRIAMDIPIRHGYFVFRVVLRPRIMQSAWDIAPLSHSIISIVARIASWKVPYHYYGFRAPSAISVMTRRNPKGELPLCHAIFTAYVYFLRDRFKCGLIYYFISHELCLFMPSSIGIIFVHSTQYHLVAHYI